MIPPRRPAPVHKPPSHLIIAKKEKNKKKKKIKHEKKHNSDKPGHKIKKAQPKCINYANSE